ncbi:sciellin isoform X3 [Hemitrygon akajei]|uniref:sciellin isoform X3 n=1 Tax=Hemitrygon akajei TaxID=2704970 RepID=UPI003BF9E7B3
MSFFNKLSKAFTDDKSSTSDERDQAIRETKKKTRLLNDGEWIKNTQSDNSQNASADVNYGKSALSRVKSEESLNRDSTGPSKVTTTKSDTIDGRKRSTWVFNGSRKKNLITRFRSEEFLNSDAADFKKTQRTSALDKPSRYKTVFTVNTSEPSERLPDKVTLSRYRSEEILNRDSDTTNLNSPTKKYPSLDRYSRNNSYKTEETTTTTYQFKTDELPKMTIVTSETKTESPTNKSAQSRSSPDGQVKTPENTSSKTNLKWDSKKDETPGSTSKTSTLEQDTSKKNNSKTEPLIDLTPSTEKPKTRSSDYTSKYGSKSLIDLSDPPEKTNDRMPSTPPPTPEKISSLIDLTPPTIPEKPKRSSGDWDTITSSTTTSSKATFDPSSKSRSSGDRDTTYSSTTTSTKSTFSPTSRSPSNNDWEPISPSTTTSTKATYDRDTKPTRSTNEQDLHNDESGYKSPTSYTKTSRNFSSKSDGGRSPSSDEYQYNSRSSYKENSLPSDDDESSGYRSPGYSLQRNWSSSSSLSDGKNPAKVITMTTNYTSAGQTTKDKNVCSQCYKPFNNSPKMILDDLNINCHASCFKCQICNRSLENLNAGDSLWVHHRTVHCESCYDRAKAQLGY